MTAVASPAPKASLSGRIWAWVPAVLLVSLLGTQLVVLQRVLKDPGFALEPDYYRKAVAWDRQRELERQSHALGWQARLRVDARAGSAGVRLRVSLTDGQGNAITGASLHVTAFANARAAQLFELELAERTPGSYEAELTTAAPGLWEFRIEATRRADRFQRVLRHSLAEKGLLP